MNELSAEILTQDPTKFDCDQRRIAPGRAITGLAGKNK